MPVGGPVPAGTAGLKRYISITMESASRTISPVPGPAQSDPGVLARGPVRPLGAAMVESLPPGRHGQTEETHKHHDYNGVCLSDVTGPIFHPSPKAVAAQASRNLKKRPPSICLLRGKGIGPDLPVFSES